MRFILRDSGFYSTLQLKHVKHASFHFCLASIVDQVGRCVSDFAYVEACAARMEELYEEKEIES